MDINHIYSRYLDQKATPEEIKLLLIYFDVSSDEDLLVLIKAEMERSAIADVQDVDLALARIHTKVKARIRKPEPLPIKHRKLWIPYAAAVLVLLSIGGYWYSTKWNVSTNKELTKLLNDALPGGNRASISFSNGRSIDLDSSQSSLVALNGKLVYTDGVELQTGDADFATVSTPVGGTYQVVLPDGTKAWLNARSSLKYPTRFTGLKREIEISGEVFLDVAPDKEHPFIVLNKKQRIEVLGTAFNIKDYDGATITTLVHGKIELFGYAEKRKVQLSPGNQSVLSSQGLSVSKVDPAEYTAWMEGLILNKDATLLEICKELERWYDVRFVFADGFRNDEMVYISLDRSELLSTVLASLEKAYFVKFSIRGKEVRVN